MMEVTSDCWKMRTILETKKAYVKSFYTTDKYNLMIKFDNDTKVSVEKPKRCQITMRQFNSDHTHQDNKKFATWVRSVAEHIEDCRLVEIETLPGETLLTFENRFHGMELVLTVFATAIFLVKNEADFPPTLVMEHPVIDEDCG